MEKPITMVKTMTAKRRQPTGGAVGRAAEEPVEVGAPDPEDEDDPDLAAPVTVVDEVGVLAVDVIPPIKTPWPLLIVLKEVQLEEEGMGCADGVTGSPW